MARKKLGAMLEKKGIITEFQLVAALSHQRKWKIKIGKALLELGYIEEKALFQVLAEQWAMELVDLYELPIPDDVKRRMSREQGTSLMAVPLKIEDDSLVVAIAEPDREHIKDDLERITGMRVKLVLAMDSQVEELARTLPEKVSVATLKPVRKAFRKNKRGGIEPLEESEADILLDREEIRAAESDKEEPVSLEDVELKPVEEEPVAKPEPIGSAELEEFEEEPPHAQKPKKDAALEVPDIAVEAKTAVNAEPEKTVESAQKAAPTQEISQPENQPAPASEEKPMEDYFPGQMRSFEEPAKEAAPELKAEENVEELVAPQIEQEPAKRKPEAEFEELAPKAKEEKPREEKMEPTTESPAAPVEMSRQSIKPGASAPAQEPKQALSGIDREAVLEQLIKIENRLKELLDTIEELREKLRP